MKDNHPSGFGVRLEYRIKILSSLLFGVLFGYFIYMAYQTVSLNYLPVFSDEYGYWLDAKNFWLYNRIDAATTLNESYAAVAHAGFHGFMYAIFYGVSFKLLALLGMTPSIPLVNTIIVLLLFTIFFLGRFAWEKKALTGIIFFSNYILIIYMSSSMTEPLHFAFAVIAAYILYLFYLKKEKKYLYLYVALIAMLIPFRESWVFALFALFPLSRSLKDFVKYALLLFLGLVLVVLYQKYFQAAFTIDYFHNIKSQMAHLPASEVFQLIFNHFMENVDKYFISETYRNYSFVFYYKYLYVAVLLSAIVDGIWKKDRLVLGAALVATVFIASLLVLYDPFAWREARTLAAPFMFLVTILILRQRYYIGLAIIAFQLFFYGQVLESKHRIDQDRYKMNTYIKENEALLNEFKELSRYVDMFDKPTVTVLMNWDLMPVDNSPMFYELPLKLNDKYIRYSFIYRHYDILDSISDLYISSRKESVANMELLGKNDHFYFYRRKQ